MNTPTQPLSVRVPTEDFAALERAAKADDRPTSWLVRKIITEWLRKQPKPR